MEGAVGSGQWAVGSGGSISVRLLKPRDSTHVEEGKPEEKSKRGQTEGAGGGWEGEVGTTRTSGLPAANASADTRWPLMTDANHKRQNVDVLIHTRTQPANAHVR